MVEKLARYTGLSAAFIQRSNLRVSDQHFFKELLRERKRTIGRLDSRFLGRGRLGVTEQPEYDPLLTNVSMGYYEAGHMMYIHIPSLAEIKRDLAEFIRSSVPGRRS